MEGRGRINQSVSTLGQALSSSSNLPRRSFSNQNNSMNTPSAINEAIQQLADHQECVQKKTFSKWVNSYLMNHNPPRKVTNLFEDIKDGIILLQLLESLSGETLPIEKASNQKRLHFISNVTTALQFLDKRKIKMVNIHPTDIVDGKPSIVLGLIWTIILYFQIEENTRLLAKAAPVVESAAAEDAKNPSPVKVTHLKQPQNARTAMLNWAQETVTADCGLEVKDFGSSWRDGVAFNAMIHSIRPELVNMDMVVNSSSRVNLENAFNMAEVHFGIPRLLDPEDVDVDKPDEKSIMTYVAKFLEKVSDYESTKFVPLDAAAQETSDIKMLIDWVNRVDEVLQIAEQEVKNIKEEYQSYEMFLEEFLRNASTFECLQSRAQKQGILKINAEYWSRLKEQWKIVTEKMTKWREKLDRSLPGRLGLVGDLVCQTETLLEKNIEICRIDSVGLGISDKSGDDLSPNQRRQELETNLRLVNESKEEVELVLRTGQYHGVPLSLEQMKDIGSRLEKISFKSQSVIHVLEHEEAKQKIQTLLDETETKMAPWLNKFGDEAHLKFLKEDYEKFVFDSKLFEEVDNAFVILKDTANAYKILDIQLGSADSVAADVDSMLENWNTLKAGLLTVKSSQEEVLRLWEFYNSVVGELKNWFTTAENVFQKSLQDQEEFFGNLEPWQAKMSVLKEYGSKLIARTDDETGQAIRKQLDSFDISWQNILSLSKTCKQNAIDAVRYDYQDRISQLKKIIVDGEKLLSFRVNADPEELEDHLDALQQFLDQKEIVEEGLAEATKIAKTLVKAGPGQVIQEMLEELRHTKEHEMNVFNELNIKNESKKKKVPTATLR